MPTTPSEDEVLTWFDQLSNWGRWGDDDQLGTLNLLLPEHTVAAASLVRTGRRVSCRTFRETEPISRDFTAPSPREPTTIAAASRSSAIETSASAMFRSSGTGSASAVPPSSRTI